MDSLQVIVDEITEHVRPRMRQDDRVEPELIAQYIRDARAQVIVRTFAGRRNLNGFAQTINIAIEPLDSKVIIVVNGKEYTYDRLPGNVYRLNLPKLVYDLGRKSIHYFGGDDMMSAYDVSYSPVFESMLFGRWNSNTPVLYSNFTDTYIYMPRPGSVMAKLVAIFANPEDVYGFTWDSPYPLPVEAKEQVTYIVRSKLLQHLGLPIDPINDNMSQSQSAMPKQQQASEQQQQEQQQTE